MSKNSLRKRLRPGAGMLRVGEKTMPTMMGQSGYRDQSEDDGSDSYHSERSSCSAPSC
jgi:hypothetical protein